MAGVVETITGAIGAGAAGGILGVFGSVIDRGFGIFERREARKDRVLDYAEAEKVRGHEVILQEMASRERREETEDALKLREAALAELSERLDGEGLLAALADQTAAVTRASPMVANILALARLGITTLLFTGMMVALAMAAFGWAGNSRDLIFQQVLDTVCFAGNVALLFWFGARPQRGAR